MQKNILEYLENTAQRLPNKLAFSTGKEGMTFLEVYNGARSIGSFLAHKGFYNEPIVIFMDKHPRTVTAFWGAIYAGCFYVCIDEKMPLSRIEAIFENLSPRVVICDKRNEKTARTFNVENVWVYDDIVTEAEDRAVLYDIRCRQCDTDPIYVVFTSGSTGVPKGVVACHRSVIDYTETLSKALGFSENTVFANQTPLYFDAPLKELMPTLKFGATTYFVPKMLFSFPVRLLDYLDENNINTVCWVVSAFVQISSLGALDNRAPKTLSTIAFGSEVFPKKQYELWRRVLPNARFFNLYGPTEATGMSCYWSADRKLTEDEPIPIGRPFDNTDILLLNDNNERAIKGEKGEICIRGTCLTLGYYNNEDKTKEAFVQNPLNTRYPELIYRTGDIGYVNEYGELVFVSRKDSQIKHMGHRIELGEIDSAAQKNELVRRTACVYDTEAKRIALFYVGDIDEKALLTSLAEYLPRYMIPAICVKLSSIPLTDNGKTDRRALKEMACKL